MLGPCLILLFVNFLTLWLKRFERFFKGKIHPNFRFVK